MDDSLDAMLESHSYPREQVKVVIPPQTAHRPQSGNYSHEDHEKGHCAAHDGHALDGRMEIVMRAIALLRIHLNQFCG